MWPAALGERNSKRLSWHTDFTANPSNPAFRNPLNNRGPIEGRPPGEVFAHQRWDEFFPKVGYVMSWGQIQAGTKFHPGMTAQIRTPSGRTAPAVSCRADYRRSSSRAATASRS